MDKVNIGDPVNRVEGSLKVTGTAQYAAEYNLPGITYGVLVTSTIAKGRIKTLHTQKAEKVHGVLSVMSHLNRPEVPGYAPGGSNSADPRVEGQEFRVFYDGRIHFNQQPIALVIAETLEIANYAATLVKAEYESEPHQTNINKNISAALKPKKEKDYSRGQAYAYRKAPVIIEQEYQTPIQVHNPMEMHAATAVWEGVDKVTVYNKTQAVKISQRDIMNAFHLIEENVRIHSPFVGGAFGSSSRVWPQEMAAILGAKKVNRPVKVMAKRDQQFNMVGYRPRSIQKVGIGATKDGILVGITHEAFGSTSTYEQFTERIVHPTKPMYKCPNLNTLYRLVPLDMSTPCWTRGPGETSGSFALESAIDEMAYALGMDPLAFRRKNYADTDPENGKPWSSKFLNECYEQGAARLGWHRRNPRPGSMQKGGMLVGMGVASGVYKSARQPANAKAILRADGSVVVRTSVADTGQGSATIFTQVVADTLGLDINQVIFEWGDSMYPEAPGQFGSHTTASVGSAIYDVCAALKLRLQELAAGQAGKLKDINEPGELIAHNGHITSKNNPSQKIAFTDILKKHHLPEVEVSIESKSGPEQEKFSSKSFCANFVEVHVNPLTGEVRVAKVVSAVDAGKIMNHKTAQGQVLGSVVWGIGLALMEEAVVDHRFGRHVTKDLADYHVPTQADVPDIDVIFIDKSDPIIGPIGSKGLGEIPMVGFTAAVANAVFHATGKRIRGLPITPDKII